MADSGATPRTKLKAKRSMQRSAIPVKVDKQKTERKTGADVDSKGSLEVKSETDYEESGDQNNESLHDVSPPSALAFSGLSTTAASSAGVVSSPVYDETRPGPPRVSPLRTNLPPSKIPVRHHTSTSDEHISTETSQELRGENPLAYETMTIGIIHSEKNQSITMPGHDSVDQLMSSIRSFVTDSDFMAAEPGRYSEPDISRPVIIDTSSTQDEDEDESEDVLVQRIAGDPIIRHHIIETTSVVDKTVVINSSGGGVKGGAADGSCSLIGRGDVACENQKPTKRRNKQRPGAELLGSPNGTHFTEKNPASKDVTLGEMELIPASGEVEKNVMTTPSCENRQWMRQRNPRRPITRTLQTSPGGGGILTDHNTTAGAISCDDVETQATDESQSVPESDEGREPGDDFRDGKVVDFTPMDDDSCEGLESGRSNYETDRDSEMKDAGGEGAESGKEVFVSTVPESETQETRDILEDCGRNTKLDKGTMFMKPTQPKIGAGCGKSNSLEGSNVKSEEEFRRGAELPGTDEWESPGLGKNKRHTGKHKGKRPEDSESQVSSVTERKERERESEENLPEDGLGDSGKSVGEIAGTDNIALMAKKKVIGVGDLDDGSKENEQMLDEEKGIRDSVTDTGVDGGSESLGKVVGREPNEAVDKATEDADAASATMRSGDKKPGKQATEKGQGSGKKKKGKSGMERPVGEALKGAGGAMGEELKGRKEKVGEELTHGMERAVEEELKGGPERVLRKELKGRREDMGGALLDDGKGGKGGIGLDDGGGGKGEAGLDDGRGSKDGEGLDDGLGGPRGAALNNEREGRGMGEYEGAKRNEAGISTEIENGGKEEHRGKGGSCLERASKGMKHLDDGNNRGKGGKARLQSGGIDVRPEELQQERGGRLWNKGGTGAEGAGGGVDVGVLGQRREGVDSRDGVGALEGGRNLGEVVARGGEMGDTGRGQVGDTRRGLVFDTERGQAGDTGRGQAGDTGQKQAGGGELLFADIKSLLQKLHEILKVNQNSSYEKENQSPLNETAEHAAGSGSRAGKERNIPQCVTSSTNEPQDGSSFVARDGDATSKATVRVRDASSGGAEGDSMRCATELLDECRKLRDCLESRRFKSTNDLEEYLKTLKRFTTELKDKRYREIMVSDETTTRHDDILTSGDDVKNSEKAEDGDKLVKKYLANLRANASVLHVKLTGRLKQWCAFDETESDLTHDLERERHLLNEIKFKLAASEDQAADVRAKARREAELDLQPLQAALLSYDPKLTSLRSANNQLIDTCTDGAHTENKAKIGHLSNELYALKQLCKQLQVVAAATAVTSVMPGEEAGSWPRRRPTGQRFAHNEALAENVSTVPSVSSSMQDKSSSTTGLCCLLLVLLIVLLLLFLLLSIWFKALRLFGPPVHLSLIHVGDMPPV